MCTIVCTYIRGPLDKSIGFFFDRYLTSIKYNFLYKINISNIKKRRIKFSAYIGGTSSVYTWPCRRIYKYICCSRPRQRTPGLCRTSYLGSRNLGLTEAFPLTWVKFYSSNKTLYFRYTHSNWQEQKFNVMGVFLLWFSEQKAQRIGCNNNILISVRGKW